MPRPGELRKLSVSAVKWGAFGNVARMGLQFGAQVVLARLLGPENYGLFALGVVVLAFSSFVSDVGLAWGLIQAQDLTEEDIRLVFTWQVVFGAIATIGLFTFASEIAMLFNEPRVAPIIQWLGLTCLIGSAAAAGSGLLMRSLAFKRINLIHIVSYSLGYLVVGVPLAYSGAGVWSLVAAWIVQAICNLILVFISQPHSIRPLFRHRRGRALSGVGFTVFVTNISNWLLSNLDRVLLGRLVDARTVGIYVMGYNLASVPNGFLLGALQQAFLAAGARIQSDLALLRRAYLSVIATVWIVISPVFVGGAILSDDLIGVVYGPTWAQSAVVFAILSLAMPAYVTWGLSTPILWNTERKHWESLLQLPILVIGPFALYNAASQGVIAVAVVAVCMILARSIVITVAACSRLKLTFRDLGPSAARAVRMIFLVAAATTLGMELGRTLGTSQPAALVGGILFGGVTYAFLPILLPKLLGPDVIAMIERFSPKFAVVLNGRLPANR